MKVLHYVDENNLTWGEAWIQLLHALADLGVQNFAVFKSGGTLAGRLAEEKIPVQTVDVPVAWLPFTARKFGTLLDTFQPDLIHTRLSSAARTGGWWGRRKKIPVLQSVDKYPKAHYHKNADFLLPCSASVRDHMLSLGFPKEHMQVWHNPIDASRYERDAAVRQATRERLGLTESQILIMGAGRFVNGKGFDVLLDAYSEILRETPQMRETSRLLLAGDGEEREKLLRQIDRLDLRKNVILPGFVADIRPFLWASDLFVLPSKTAEAFGIILLEAMAAGLPCIATCTGGPVDMIDDQKDGWLVEPNTAKPLASALEKALCDDDMLRAVALAAREKAARFDTGVIADQLLQIYKKSVLLKKYTK